MHAKLTTIRHPLGQIGLTRLRSVATTNNEFRSTLKEVTRFLLYESLREMETKPVNVVTPLGESFGVTFDSSTVFIPILRAGLGMVEAAHELIPSAQIGFVGIARDEKTAQPHRYYESLPSDLRQSRVIVLDPMLATGGSLRETISVLEQHHAHSVTVITVLAAPAGVSAVCALPTVRSLYTLAVDPTLTEQNFIYPGLGDAGNRQFGDPQ